MKRNFLILLSSIFMLTSCSLDNDNTDAPEIILVTWHLIETNGGIAGINDQFNLDTIIWSFSGANGSLVVENNNTTDTKQDLLDSGIYSFTISTINEENFIFIDDIEYGQITIVTDGFTIDENNRTNGQLADGFVYTFQKVENVL